MLADAVIVNSIEFKKQMINRFGIKVHCIYNPLNILEIKLQARINQNDKIGAQNPNPEYLIQTHFWF